MVTWPKPARAAARAVRPRDQPCPRANTAIGAQWSGTIVCRTPTAATVAISKDADVIAVDFPRVASIDQFEYWNNEGGARWTKFAGAYDDPLHSADRRALARRSSAARRSTSLTSAVVRRGQRSSSRKRFGPVASWDSISRASSSMLRARTCARSGADDVELILVRCINDTPSAARFDLVFSQFGVMFFSDPVAAFANLRRALKPNGRIAFACWRTMEENPWFSVPFAEAKRFAPPPQPAAARCARTACICGCKARRTDSDGSWIFGYHDRAARRAAVDRKTGSTRRREIHARHASARRVDCSTASTKMLGELQKTRSASHCKSARQSPGCTSAQGFGS